VVQAFGDDSAATICLEAKRHDSRERPIDVLLAHPSVGLVAIEVKGWRLENILSVANQAFVVRHPTERKPEDPFAQAQLARDFFVHKVKEIGGSAPIGFEIVAFPLVTVKDWNGRGFDACFPMNHVILKCDLESGASGLLRKLSAVAFGILKKSTRSAALTRRQADAARMALGTSAMVGARRHAPAVPAPAKLGHKLDEIANAERPLTDEQEKLSRLQVNGAPRLIRGVAGSGKSVVLARLVARAIAQILQPEQLQLDVGVQEGKYELGVVCFNRCLVPLLREQIALYYRDLTLTDLPNDIPRVVHMNGLMHELAKDGMVKYVRVEDAPVEERASHYLEQVHAYAIRVGPTGRFDALFIDEGQDLCADDYRVLQQVVRPHGKDHLRSMVIFYDDAQNIYGLPRPHWKRLGIGVEGRSHVMRECFRNHKQTLSTAFNLLVGSCGDRRQVPTGIHEYADVHYLTKEHLIVDRGAWYDVEFCKQVGCVPIFQAFPDRSAEQAWLCQELRRLIVDESVRPEDILVLYSRKDLWRDVGAEIQHYLGSAIRGLRRPDLNKSERDLRLIDTGYLAVTTAASAKGYDAFIVFVVGLDDYGLDTHGRAMSYVAATRAKYQLYLSGIKGQGLMAEAEAVVKRVRAEITTATASGDSA
jgi:superfamily I DNA and RNA helicase